MSRPQLARTPDGRRLELTRVIAEDPELVWRLFVETRYWTEWGPSVRAVDCEDERIRSGSSGRVRVLGGLWFPFEIDAFSPPEESADGATGRWTWRIARIPATGHRVEAAPGGARAVFELPVVAAGYAPVCRRALARIETLATADA